LGSSGVGGVGGGRKEGRGEMGHNVSKHAGGSKSGGGHLREEQFSGVALIQLISVICVPIFAESSVCKRSSYSAGGGDF
jgi:hypothetical protein